MGMRRLIIQYDKETRSSMPTSKEKQEVSLKELRKDYYKLRNFEISNLWQRSIFLSAILVLLFTGYGGSCVKLIDCLTTDAYWFNLLSLAIAVVGLCFSCLWIMMAKGSKMWYEVYENRIYEIERKTELGIDSEWRMENAKGSRCKEADLMNTDAGAYSVSRINILIGQVMFVIWSFEILVHSVILIFSMFEYQLPQNIISMGVIVITILTIILSVFVLPYCARSSWSRKDKSKKNKTRTTESSRC